MAELKKEQGLRIGELAAAVDLNPKTIRYYEEIGLLPQPQRSAARYRLYGEADCERLRFILKAKAVGLALEEIGEILAMCDQGERPCEHVLALLDSKLAAVDEQLRALTEFRQELVALRREATETMAAEAQRCGIIERHQVAHAYEPEPDGKGALRSLRRR